MDPMLQGLRRGRGRPKGTPNPPGAKNAPKVERDAEIITMYKEGLTLQDIGEAFDITRERVRQILHKAGITRREGGAIVRARDIRETRRRAQNEQYIEKWGHGVAKHRGLLAAGKLMRQHTEKKTRDSSPVGAYRRQERNAHLRGHEWKLTLADWWACWEKSGKWHLRGRGAEKYVLTRLDPRKPFEVGNITIMKFRKAVMQRTSDRRFR